MQRKPILKDDFHCRSSQLGISQQLPNISWSVLTRDDGVGFVVYPLINQSNFGLNNEYVDQMNDTVQFFLTELMSSYADGTYFSFFAQVKRYDERYLSILYEGEVWTPAKAIGQAFALNLDMESGTLLSLKDFVCITDVTEGLIDGSVREYSAKGRERFEIPPHIAFGNSRVLDFDINHTHDFFLDDDCVYIIISKSPPSGWYSIFVVEL